jgi:hypothetical protein
MLTIFFFKSDCAFKIVGKFNKFGINQYPIKSTGIMYKIRELILLWNLGTIRQKISNKQVWFGYTHCV